MSHASPAAAAVRPFRLLGDGELAWLQADALQVCAVWAGEWLHAPPAPRLVLRAAQAVAPLEAPAAPSAWLSAHEGEAGCHVAASALEALLFGHSAVAEPSHLAGEVARAAAQDLAQRFLPGAAAALLGQAAPPPAALRRGAGAVWLEIELGEARLAGLVDGEAVRRRLARRAPVVRPPAARPEDPRGAIAGGCVIVEAWGGHSEIDVASLQSLAVGDVIPLDLGVHEGLLLTIGGRPTNRRAYLGSHGAHRALRLTARTEAPDS